MTAGLSPFSFGPFSDEIAQRLRMGQPYGVATGFPQAPQIAWPPQAQADDVPDAVPPGYSGFVPPSAPTMQAQPAPAGAADVAAQTATTPPSMVGAQMPPFGFGGTPVTRAEFDDRFGAAPPGESSGISAAQADALRAGLLRSGETSPAPVAAPARRGQAPVVSAATAPKADMPAENAAPAQGQMPAPVAAQPAAPAEPGFDLSAGLKRFRDAGGGDLLTSLGIGLMSTRGLGAGLAAGLQNDQKQQAVRSASGLANAEMDLKRQKLAREAQGQNQTKAWLIGRGLDPAAAEAAVANPTVLSATVAQMNKEPSRVTIGGNIYELKPGDRPSDANKLGPAKAENDGLTADQKNYEAAKQGGYTKSFLDYQLEKANASRAQTTVNATVNPILKGLSEQFATGAEGARASADVVRAVQNARSQIEAPGGIIAGKFADNNLALQKIGAAFGVTDPQAIVNTETFRTQIKPIVLETVKGLGAGSGVSNADRDFALQAVGGDINLDPGTIKRVLDITEKAARAKVERHNALSDQMLETQPELKQVAPMLRIALPEASPAPAMPAGGARRLRFNPGTGEFR